MRLYLVGVLAVAARLDEFSRSLSSTRLLGATGIDNQTVIPLFNQLL